MVMHLDLYRMAKRGPWCATLVSLLLCAGFLAQCGPNRLEPQAPESPFEQAQNHMEAGRYEAAKQLLEQHLARTPQDHNARALLAACHAAQAGVSVFAILESSLGTSGTPQSNENGNSEGDLVASLVPEPTDSNREFMKSARDIIQSIPESNRVGDIAVAATLYVSVWTILTLKSLAASSTPPTLEEALEVIESLDDAAALATANGIPSAQIDGVRSQIAGESGANDAERLSSYLARVKSQNGGVLPSPSAPRP
jgi:hypothetical protein